MAKETVARQSADSADTQTEEFSATAHEISSTQNLDITVERAIERTNHFHDMQVWLLSPRIDAQAWLRNFEENELPYAVCLLNSFFFINEKMCNALFRRAFHNLSQTIEGDQSTKQQEWENLLQNSIFTTINIENTNVTASGNLFCHRAKKILRIPENLFMNWEQALIALETGSKKSVIFLDDFIGSGNQFIETWCEELVNHGKSISFQKLEKEKDIKFRYASLIATDYGVHAIHEVSPNLMISAGNIIDKKYSALSSNSIIWGDDLKPGAQAFLKETSKRAGFENDWAGYDRLALTIAFSHGAPDATLPLLLSSKNGWQPLIEWQ